MSSLEGAFSADRNLKARGFNEDLSLWDVSNVESADNMFAGATLFNQDLSRWEWNAGRLKSWNNMFADASSFNQDLCKWGWKLSLTMQDDKLKKIGVNDMFKGTKCPGHNATVNLVAKPMGSPLCHECALPAAAPTEGST